MDINEKCFLCKISNADTEEHVFPKWLQKKFQLWNQRITLKNGTTYRYKDIRIPCCNECNSKYLATIENQIKGWIETNSAIDEKTIFIWMFKIMYGLHYKELFLKNNIKDKDSESIVKHEEILARDSVNIFLFYALDKVQFVNFKPYSIYICELDDAKLDNYFYVDEPYKLYSCIQLGKIGIVCSFQDDGYINGHIKLVNNFREPFKINQNKFAEIACLVMDLKCRMKMLPNYLVSINNGVFSFSIQPTDSKSLFKDFEIDNFMKILTSIYKHYFVKMTVKDVNGEENINYKSQIVYI